MATPAPGATRNSGPVEEFVRRRLGAFRDSATGANRDPDYQYTPGMNVSSFAGSGQSQAAQVLASLASTDEESFMEIMRSTSPEMDDDNLWQQDANGRWMGRIPGGAFEYINEPGFTGADLGGLVKDIVSFYPAMRVATIARAALPRIASGAALSGLTSLGQDAGSRAAGSDQDYDWLRAGMNTVLGGFGASAIPGTRATGERMFHGMGHKKWKGEFDPAMRGSRNDGGFIGEGDYLSPQSRIARSGPYGPRVGEFDVTINNPLELRAIDYPELGLRDVPGVSPQNNRVFSVGSYQGPHLVREALGMPQTGQGFVPGNPTAAGDEIFEIGGSQEITRRAREQGYDSVTLDFTDAGYPGKEVVVFDTANTRRMGSPSEIRDNVISNQGWINGAPPVVQEQIDSFSPERQEAIDTRRDSPVQRLINERVDTIQGLQAERRARMDGLMEGAPERPRQSVSEYMNATQADEEAHRQAMRPYWDYQESAQQNQREWRENNQNPRRDAMIRHYRDLQQAEEDRLRALEMERRTR